MITLQKQFSICLPGSKIRICHPWKMTGEWSILFSSRFSSASATPRLGSKIKVGAQSLAVVGNAYLGGPCCCLGPCPWSFLATESRGHAQKLSFNHSPGNQGSFRTANHLLSTNTSGGRGLASENQDRVEQGLTALQPPIISLFWEPGPPLSLLHLLASLGPGRSTGLWPFRLTL